VAGFHSLPAPHEDFVPVCQFFPIVPSVRCRRAPAGADMFEGFRHGLDFAADYLGGDLPLRGNRLLGELRCGRYGEGPVAHRFDDFRLGFSLHALALAHGTRSATVPESRAIMPVCRPPQWSGTSRTPTWGSSAAESGCDSGCTSGAFACAGCATAT
jgi:hypothetical protein